MMRTADKGPAGVETDLVVRLDAVTADIGQAIADRSAVLVGLARLETLLEELGGRVDEIGRRLDALGVLDDTPGFRSSGWQPRLSPS